MAFLPADQQELFLALVEGIHSNPPWSAFLRDLVAKTHARRAFLLIALANAPADQPPAVLHMAALRAGPEPLLDPAGLHGLGLHPYALLRPGRVYSLDEMLDYDRPDQLAQQRAALDAMGIRFGRWLRVTAAGAADAWLVLVREREDFSAAAVSTLTTIAPHFAAALRTFGALAVQRLSAAMAQEALTCLGVGQLALDAVGRVMAADPEAERLLSFAPEPDQTQSRRLQLLPETSRALESRCALLAQAASDASAALLIDERRGLWLLLRRAQLALQGPHAAPAVLATVRTDRRENVLAAIRTIAVIHGLSEREAALAHAISMGETIAEAGKRLGLTQETARNYSKRIYAKTGAMGQADLVRLLLTGLAPFC